MISRRFFIGTLATVPTVVALAPLPSAAAGIGEKARRPGAGRPRRAGDCDRVFLAHLPGHCQMVPSRTSTTRSSATMWKPARCASWRATSRSMRPRFRRRCFPTALVGTAISPSSTSCSRPSTTGPPTRDYTEKLAQIGELGGVSRDRFEACLADKGLENVIFPVDGIGPGRIRRKQHADGDRQWREIRGQDELRGARQAN